MRIAFATAELAPHAHVGGLGDVARWLPRFLAATGDDVRVFVPHYDVFDPDGLEVRPLIFDLRLGSLGSVTVSSLGQTDPGEPAIYLVDAPGWFDRGAVYDLADDGHLRYAVLSRAVIATCDELGWVPDVVHCNDWHTALLPLLTTAQGPPWDEVATVLTIHNLAYQGVFPGSDLTRIGLGDPGTDEVNSLRVGIENADVVTTVSRTHAIEIVAPGGGFGLEGALVARGDRLVGILNGIGPDWGPANDQWIPHPYSEPSGKAPNTAALRQRVGLNARDVPLLGMVGRVDTQKGHDLILDVLPDHLDAGRVQLVVLGRGDPALEGRLGELADRFAGSVAFSAEFDQGLGHLIEAGADMFPMPSRFEPCGLNQMYSMAYGTVPIVRRTGGLADTVSEWDGSSGTGFLFDEYSAGGFDAALRQALSVYEDQAAWRQLMANGMARDFTWQPRAAEYRNVYETAIAVQEAS